MSSRILCIIPARSGSKGLRGKNIRKIGDKTLLNRAIELAHKSRRCGEDWTITVSTDSHRYAKAARIAGALVPQLRPKLLAQDSTPLIDAVLHTYRIFTASNESFDTIVMLPPTTPLTLPLDVRRALKLYHKVKNPSVISVVEEQIPPGWRFKKENGRLVQKEPGSIRHRQQGRTEYKLNGAIYIAEPTWLERNGQFHKNKVSIPLVMPNSRSLDIETYPDLVLARKLLDA